MFSNYVLTGWRHIMNNRLYSAINIFGLAVGLMSCIIIMLYVRHEISFDQNIPNADRIVRLHSAFVPPNRPPFKTVRSAGRMMEALKAYAPGEIEEGVRIFSGGFTIIRDDLVFDEEVAMADATFFNVFDLPFAYGSPEASFVNPNDTIVSEEMAIKYFGRTDVVGETLRLGGMEDEPIDIKITGVLKTLPENSHMRLDFVSVIDTVAFEPYPNILDTWTSVNVYTYFMLRPGATVETLKERLYHWIDNESIFVNNDQIPGKPSDVVKPNLMKVSDIHLYAAPDAGSMGDMQPLGDVRIVYAFTGIAVLILTIASINFMNLATARASKRAREVALRKVLGASRNQVAGQFLGEALVVSMVALVFAVAAVEICLPMFNSILGQNLSLELIDDWPFLVSLVVMTALVGLLSGLYPAAILSRFLPARILKANQSSGGEGSMNLRSMLVVFQFAISIALVIGTAVIYGQTLYVKTLDTGYSTEGKLVLAGFDAMSDNSQKFAMARQLESLPGVTSVSLSSEVPSQDRENNTQFRLLSDGEETGSETNAPILNYYGMGMGFFEDYDIQPIAGRTFSEQYGSDVIQQLAEDQEGPGKASIILNETAARQLGFNDPAQAIGRVVESQLFRTGLYHLEIVGVIPDLYFRSLKFGVRPSVYVANPNFYRAATISYNSANIAELIEQVEAVWREMMPLTPVNHQFLNDMMNAQYQAEDRQANLLAVSAILAILIACLGLYGLASFTAEQRTKEIGVRKVLGARVMDIVRLLVWQFSRPVLVANIIAWPIASYFMFGWLEGFTYRLDSNFVLYIAVGAGLMTLVIAWITVAARAIKVASTNPIQALRYE